MTRKWQDTSGLQKHRTKLRQTFGMTEDVRRYCKSCDICQRTIHKGSLTPAPLGKIGKPVVISKRFITSQR